MNWSTVQAAIAAWVSSSTGLATSQIRWARQNAPIPTGAWASLRVIGLSQDGRDATSIEDTSGSPAAGSEITYRAQGWRLLTLSVQIFGAAAQGSASPEALLDNLQTGARMPLRAAALLAAGVGVLSFDPVVQLDGAIDEATVDPRAAMTIRLCVASDVTEVGTYIEIVEIEDEDRGDTFTVTL